jgi:hypothetical protein
MSRFVRHAAILGALASTIAFLFCPAAAALTEGCGLYSNDFDAGDTTYWDGDTQWEVVGDPTLPVGTKDKVYGRTDAGLLKDSIYHGKDDIAFEWMTYVVSFNFTLKDGKPLVGAATVGFYVHFKTPNDYMKIEVGADSIDVVVVVGGTEQSRTSTASTISTETNKAHGVVIGVTDKCLVFFVGAGVVWNSCIITPNPAPRLGAGGLTVDVNYSFGASVTELLIDPSWMLDTGTIGFEVVPDTAAGFSQSDVVFDDVCVDGIPPEEESSTVRRVDLNNLTPSDGSTWGKAFNTIQEGIDALAAGGGEVWVAQGAYTGTATHVLELKEGVNVYGGFSGLGTETKRSQRNWVTNVTTIDGEGGRRCVLGLSSGTCVLDGFTLANGHAPDPGGDGGGLLNGAGAPSISDCTFSNNTADANGGGVSNTAGSPRIVNCVFTGNHAVANGGGVYNKQNPSAPTVTNCTFLGSSAALGDGIYDLDGSTRVTNCILWDATRQPAEIASGTNSKITVTFSDVLMPLFALYPGEGNIDLDPLFDTAGAHPLALSPGSPCIDTATDIGAPSRDILGTIRPQSVGFDMGAYEFLQEVCDAGGLIVARAVRAYLVPQGVALADRTRQMPLNVVSRTATGARFTNSMTFTTFLFSAPPAPRADYAILDGDAVIDLVSGGESVPPTGLAAEGRHLLIDTIPPEVIVTRYNPSPQPPQSDGMPNVDMILTLQYTGPFAALGYTGPFPTGGVNPNGYDWKQFDRTIPGRSSHSPFIFYGDPTAIYNVGSVSNGYFGDRLDLLVMITVNDRNVYEAYGIVPDPAYDTDAQYGGSMVRQVTGFAVNDPSKPLNLSNITGQAAPTATEAGTGKTVPLAGWWKVVDFVGKGSLDVDATTSTTGDPNWSNAGYFNISNFPANPELQVETAKRGIVIWDFVADGVAGISLSAVSGGQLVLQGTLQGQDRVGNRTADEAGLQRPNLRVLWLSGDRMLRDMSFRPAGSEGGLEGFSWALGTSLLGLTYDLGPVPMYTYRVWQTETAGKQNKDDIYDPLLDMNGNPTTWQPWSPTATSLSPQGLKDLGVGDDSKDHWLLVTVGGMDEAGNVTQWPSDLDLASDPGRLWVLSTADKGRNWYRFFFPGESSSVDTTLAIRFTYNLADNPDAPNAQKADLDAATILEYPPADQIIVGTFDVGLVRPSDCQSASVILELERDGQVVFRTTIDANGSDRVTLKLPQNGLPNEITPQPEDVFLPHPPPPPYPPFSQVRFPRVVNYVLRATTVAQCLDASGFPAQLADTTPANFSFKVVPGTIEQYLKSSGGEQPVKVFERE